METEASCFLTLDVYITHLQNIPWRQKVKVRAPTHDRLHRTRPVCDTSRHVIYTRVDANVRLWVNRQVLHSFRGGICFGFSRIILLLSISLLALALFVLKSGRFGIGSCFFGCFSQTTLFFREVWCNHRVDWSLVVSSTYASWP